MVRANTVWTEKHKPCSTSEVVGNRDSIQKLVQWIKSWENGTPKKRAIFLHGPPGVGKTVSVETVANDLKMELVETNASDYRTEKAIKKIVGTAAQYKTLSGKKRLILFDELDGITGTQDRGGVAAIIKVVKNTQSPVALIANSLYNPRFASLRFYCEIVEFKRPPAREVLRHLKIICSRENIDAEDNALQFIAQRCEGDVRSAVNDLQALAQGRKRLTYQDVSWLAHRNRKSVIFNVLRLIFYGKTCKGAKKAVDMADVDYNMLFHWIYENLPHHLKDPRDLANAMSSLATADLYRGRIRSTGNWKLAAYVFDFMTAGVTMSRRYSKPSGWVPLRFPERIRFLSKSKKERSMQLSICLKIKERCHISASRSKREFLPYLKTIFSKNVEMATGLAQWFNFDANMIEYLAGGKRQTNKILKRAKLAS